MIQSSDVQDEVNRRVYHRAGIVDAYRSETLLTRTEATALLKYQPAFAGKSVLDVGVGTGRTTLYLQPLARSYLAIDYSPEMVAWMKDAFPTVAVGLADMRNLSGLDPASFDFIIASANVIDAVGHEDRISTLREFGRVLRSGGMVIFSSHNKDYHNATSRPSIQRSRNPVTELVLLKTWFVQLYNYYRYASMRRVCAEYAILTDRGHNYACLHYYISQSMQRRQLESVGFDTLEVFDKNGGSLAADSSAGDSGHLLYVARKR